MLAVLLSASVAWSGDLDSAYDFWDAVIVLLGGDPGSGSAYVDYDSLRVVNPYVNAGLRQINNIKPRMGSEKVVVASLSDGGISFYYTLTTDFIPGGLPGFPLRVTVTDKEKLYAYGADLVEQHEFDCPLTGPVSGPIYNMTDNELWVCVQPFCRAGDTIYIEGPVAALVFSGPNDTTNVYPHLRWGAVYWAAWLTGASAGNPSADVARQAYYEFIARLGVQLAPTGGL